MYGGRITSRRKIGDQHVRRCRHRRSCIIAGGVYVSFSHRKKKKETTGFDPTDRPQRHRFETPIKGREYFVVREGGTQSLSRMISGITIAQAST